jgi:hypothetical protein
MLASAVGSGLLHRNGWGPRQGAGLGLLKAGLRLYLPRTTDLFKILSWLEFSLSMRCLAGYDD